MGFSFLKRIAIILIVISAIFGLGRLYFVLNDGFTLYSIRSSFAHRENWHCASLSNEEMEKIHEILNQRFTYLGKGAQIYAFLSSDGNYVLKIIKQKDLKPPLWQEALAYIPSFKTYLANQEAIRKKNIQNLLESCKIAYEELRDETAIVYLHLNQTDTLHKPTTISDKLGMSYVIDLDKTEFLLQKKAILLTTMIDRMMQESEEKGHELLHRLFEFLSMISQKGIVEWDRRLTENIGLIGEQLIFIDTGRFSRDEQVKQRENYQKSLPFRTSLLKKWLETHYPNLIGTLENEIQN